MAERLRPVETWTESGYVKVTSAKDWWNERVQPYRHVYLLFCLVALIVVQPFLKEGGVSFRVLESLQYVMLVIAANAAITTKRGAWFIGALLAGSVILRVAKDFNEDPALAYAFLLCWIAFYAAVTCTLLGSLFRRTTRVTADTLCAASSVYLLLGMIWALAYAILNFSMEGSFTPEFGVGEEYVDYQRFLGFSYTTLTTLGYGNISPATPQADALTSAEAIVGQLYVAIVMARLVALQLINPKDRDED